MKPRSHTEPAVPPPADDATGEALIFGCILDGKGGARDATWEQARAWSPGDNDEVLWLHVDRTVPGMAEWLAREFQIAPATIEVLVSNETRPRGFAEHGHLITVLRGINFNPGAEPCDMIAMQMWSDGKRVITLRRRRLQTPHDVHDWLTAGNGPTNAGSLIAMLAKRLVSKMNPSIVDMNDRIDRLEETIHDDDAFDAMLAEIGDIRRECLSMKRFMSPQHEALEQILANAPSWFSQHDRHIIREAIDRLRRYLEDLDVSKESAIVLQDDINNRAASQSSRTMYMLSIVAAIFLPLGFLTGLLGINVGGMPGVHDDHAFWITVIALGTVFLFQLLLFRKLKWL